MPFHFWTPDVYEGAPTPVTAFFSVGPKLAAYAVLARVFYVAFPRFHADWGLIVALVSAATMIWGNVAALMQTNVKRMLAYSSISHAGYALLGVLGFRTAFGLWGVLVYLLAYTFMNFGAFALVIFLETKGYAAETVADFNGLARRNMTAAVVMLVFLLSLAGIPPTAGFIGKYYLFTAALKAGYPWLVVLGTADLGRLALLLLPDRRGDVLLRGRRREVPRVRRADRRRRHLRGGDAARRHRARVRPPGPARLRAREVLTRVFRGHAAGDSARASPVSARPKARRRA